MSTEGRCGGSASGDIDMVSSEATVRWIPLDRESLDLCLKSESGLWTDKEGFIQTEAEMCRPAFE